MHDDADSMYLLVPSIIVDHTVIPPDSDLESISPILTGSIPRPNHEFIRTLTVCGTFALELGSITALVDHQPIVAAGVEVQVTSMELEFGLPAGYAGALLVLGDKAEV
ncbi:MAG: hypothetical protein WBD62_05765, partial [Anaerolineales bacterium]